MLVFEYVAKPFKRSGMRPVDQLWLFEGHYGWLDDAAGKLEGYPERIAEILGSNPNITERRAAAVAEHVRASIEALLRIAR